MDTTALGIAAQAMGAGRQRKEDSLDYSVGFVLPVRIGDEVFPGDPFFTLYARNEDEADRAEEAIRSAIVLSEEAAVRPPLWYAQVTRDGVIKPS